MFINAFIEYEIENLHIDWLVSEFHHPHSKRYLIRLVMEEHLCGYWGLLNFIYPTDFLLWLLIEPLPKFNIMPYILYRMGISRHIFYNLQRNNYNSDSDSSDISYSTIDSNYWDLEQETFKCFLKQANEYQWNIIQKKFEQAFILWMLL